MMGSCRLQPPLCSSSAPDVFWDRTPGCPVCWHVKVTGERRIVAVDGLFPTAASRVRSQVRSCQILGVPIGIRTDENANPGGALAVSCHLQVQL
jgi:hypothetical protein